MESAGSETFLKTNMILGSQKNSGYHDTQCFLFVRLFWGVFWGLRVFVLFRLLFSATPEAYGSSQARG